MEKQSLTMTAQFKKVKEINKNITLARCYVCAEGPNRNHSVIEHDVIESAIPTLFNIPVVAHLYQDEAGNYQVGGHDMILVKDEDGNCKFKSLCVPFGVVPERPDDIKYVEVEEKGGRGIHTYLTCPVLLWTGRYPELAKAYLDEEKLFSQSMEIDVIKHEVWNEDKNYTKIDEFSFSALCLLGAGVEPCFPESRIESFSLEDAKFSELFAQFKKELADCFNPEKGGNDMTDTVENVVEDAAIENVTENEEVVEEFVETTETTDETENEENTTEESFEVNEEVIESEEANEVSVFSTTVNEKREALQSALKPVITRDENDDFVQRIFYYVCDMDDTFAYVEEETCTPKDYVCKKRRIKYTFDETTKTAQLVGDFEDCVVRWISYAEDQELDAMRAEYAALVDYKATREEEDKHVQYDSALEEFADLEGNSEYATIVANRYEYESIEALKDACYLVRGKFGLVANAKKTTQSEPVILVQTPKTMTLRERFFAEYGNK